LGIVTRKEVTIHGKSFMLYGVRPLKFDMREALWDYAQHVSPVKVAQSEIKEITGSGKKNSQKFGIYNLG